MNIGLNATILTMALCVLPLSGCGDEENVPASDIPPQSMDSTPVEMAVSLGDIDMTRAAASGLDNSGVVKMQWEEGDRIFFYYTKTAADDKEIHNVFTLSEIDEDDPRKAIFTCPDFILPRGILEGKMVYVGDRDMYNLDDLLPQSFDLGHQRQVGNNSLSNIGRYCHMASRWFDAIGVDLISEASLSMRHSFSVLTLQVKRPDDWKGRIREITLRMESGNVMLSGTSDNCIVMNLEDADWIDTASLTRVAQGSADNGDDTLLDSDERLFVHFVVHMSGLVNPGDKWTITVKEESDGIGQGGEFTLSTSARQLNEGVHYSSFISSDPDDYKASVDIGIPGFEEGGSAF